MIYHYTISLYTTVPSISPYTTIPAISLYTTTLSPTHDISKHVRALCLTKGTPLSSTKSLRKLLQRFEHSQNTPSDSELEMNVQDFQIMLDLLSIPYRLWDADQPHLVSGWVHLTPFFRQSLIMNPTTEDVTPHDIVQSQHGYHVLATPGTSNIPGIQFRLNTALSRTKQRISNFLQHLRTRQGVRIEEPPDPRQLHINTILPQSEILDVALSSRARRHLAQRSPTDHIHLRHLMCTMGRVYCLTL